MRIYFSGGYIIIVEAVLFIAIAIAIVVGMISPVILEYSSIQAFGQSKRAMLAADSGMNEILYRLKNNKTTPSTLNINFASSTATINVANTTGGKRISVVAQSGEFIRSTRLDVLYGTGISFHYGIQSGQGGFVLNNSSSITGNVFSIGSVIGSGNIIRGDVISAGSSGLISGIHATGTAYAHTIDDSIIDKDVYYMSISDTIVYGTSNPGSPDQGPVELPISDEQITIWEHDAERGGIMDKADCDSFNISSNTCTISSSRTLGPIKIPFNLVIKSSSAVINVAGQVWVTGNISTQTGPTIKMDSGLGTASVAFIADNLDNRSTSSLIDIGQSTTFQGLGSIKSYVFMISQNNSAENGGSINAISMSQGAAALVVYASHGQISLSQSVSLKEATAYKIILSNTANVTYDTGLPNVLFSAGPGGGYDHLEWDEI